MTQIHGHHDFSIRHVRHCFDLRQSLTCCSDSTLEQYRPDLEVTGWGFPRICRDYDKVKAFPEKYRTNDFQSFSTGMVRNPPEPETVKSD